jgi:hypothetical protein
MIPAVKKAQQLERLNLLGNTFEKVELAAELVKALKALPNLKTLSRIDLSSPRSTTSLALDLFHAIMMTHWRKEKTDSMGIIDLPHLNMSGQRLKVPGLLHLLRALESSSLTSLNISDNNIGDAGVFSILSVPNVSIKSLNIANCQVGDMGAVALSIFLNQDSTRLKELIMNDNHVTHVGVAYIFDAVRIRLQKPEDQQLEALCLNCNTNLSEPFDPDQIQHDIQHQASRLHFPRVAPPLQDSSAVEILVQVLEHHLYLFRLHVDAHEKMNSRDIQTIRMALRLNAALTDCLLKLGDRVILSFQLSLELSASLSTFQICTCRNSSKRSSESSTQPPPLLSTSSLSLSRSSSMSFSHSTASMSPSIPAALSVAVELWQGFELADRNHFRRALGEPTNPKFGDMSQDATTVVSAIACDVSDAPVVQPYESERTFFLERSKLKTISSVGQGQFGDVLKCIRVDEEKAELCLKRPVENPDTDAQSQKRSERVVAISQINEFGVVNELQGIKKEKLQANFCVFATKFTVEKRQHSDKLTLGIVLPYLSMGGLDSYINFQLAEKSRCIHVISCLKILQL